MVNNFGSFHELIFHSQNAFKESYIEPVRLEQVIQGQIDRISTRGARIGFYRINGTVPKEMVSRAS